MKNELNNHNNDFYIESEIERANYLIIAGEEKVNCFAAIYGDKKEKLFDFESSLILDEEEDVEVVIKQSQQVDVDAIKKNSIIKLVYEFDGIKTNAECFLRHSRIENEDVILSVSSPYKMHRSQKRNSARVSMSEGFEARVVLDENESFLVNLPVLNLSTGGVALLVKAPKEFVKTDMIYSNAKIQLPLKFNNVFTSKMQLCHVSKVERSSLPEYLKNEITSDDWYQVGIKFLDVYPKMEHSLIMVVNQGLRNEAQII